MDEGRIRDTYPPVDLGYGDRSPGALPRAPRGSDVDRRLSFRAARQAIRVGRNLCERGGLEGITVCVISDL